MIERQSWSVLCDGPSIEHLRPEDVEGTAVVAVNCTIALVQRGIPIDIWATTDCPARLWGWSAPHRALLPDLELFTTDNYILTLHYQHGVPIEKIWAVPPPYMGEHRAKEGHRIVLPTLFTVLSWLYKLGQSPVRVFGADMRGTGSPLASWNPWRPEESEGVRWRWGNEREALAHAARLYRSRSLRLERVRLAAPLPALAAA